MSATMKVHSGKLYRAHLVKIDIDDERTTGQSYQWIVAPSSLMALAHAEDIAARCDMIVASLDLAAREAVSLLT
jgi:hypothetical protein